MSPDDSCRAGAACRKRATVARQAQAASCGSISARCREPWPGRDKANATRPPAAGVAPMLRHAARFLPFLNRQPLGGPPRDGGLPAAPASERQTRRRYPARRSLLSPSCSDAGRLHLRRRAHGRHLPPRDPAPDHFRAQADQLSPAPAAGSHWPLGGRPQWRRFLLAWRFRLRLHEGAPCSVFCCWS